MEEIPFNAETINKSLDLVSDSTKEARKEVDKIAAKGFNKLAQLFWSTPIGIKADVYIQERPYKMQKALEEMKRKYEEIPEKNRIEPTSYIALKSINELNYCLDENHLKEMFEALLISDMDNKKHDRVLPSYIEIIKQLSKEDAVFLKTLKDCSSYTRGFFCIELNNKDKHILLEYSDINGKLSDFNLIKLNSIIIDNLIRLRLIEIPDRIFVNQKVYDKMYESLHQPTMLEVINYTPRILSVTDFGKNFIDICLS